MKKGLVTATLLGFAVATTAMAQMKTKAGYGDAGCGLGSMLFGNQKGPVQILAATTNGTSGSQTFGMSTGTSNCSSVFGKSTVDFIEANKISLTNDVARGSGETISSLSVMFGCQDSKNFGSELQNNYKTIFTKDSAADINNAIIETIKKSNISCDLV
jgi:hypothetical protein